METIRPGWYFVGNRQRSVWSGVAIAGSLFRHLLHSLSLFLFYLLRSLSSTVSLTLFFPPLLPFLSSLSQTRSTAPSFFIYVIARHSRDRRDALAITFICFICARNGVRETNLAEKERLLLWDIKFALMIRRTEKIRASWGEVVS